MLPLAKSKDDFLLGADVLDGRGSSPDLPPEDVVEDVDRVLLAFEVDPVKVGQDQQQQPRVVRLLLGSGKISAWAKKFARGTLSGLLQA